MKTVLFAHLDNLPHERQVYNGPILSLHHVAGPHASDAYRSSSRPTDTALVLELPGATGVAAGVAAAAVGFRPIPLFNALPGHPFLALGALVDLWPTMEALVALAPMLAACSLPAVAPPAFLVDANRRNGRRPLFPHPAAFDNRSVLSEGDFPSARELTLAGITRVVLVRAARSPDLADDLVRALAGWRDAGVAFFEAALDASDGPPRPLALRGPTLATRLRALAHRVTRNRRPDGAFGAYISSRPLLRRRGPKAGFG